MATQAAKTRIKKNYVCHWTGTRGGQKSMKFFTKQGAEAHGRAQKAAGFKGVKVRRQTALKVKVNG